MTDRGDRGSGDRGSGDRGSGDRGSGDQTGGEQPCTAPGKRPTGIPGFDQVSRGGLPLGSATLLLGGPGDEQAGWIRRRREGGDR